MRIIILRALKLGDFLTGVPAYRAIRTAYPHAWIQLAAPGMFAEFLTLLDGAIDEIVPVGELQPLPHSVFGADFGIDLHGKGVASHRILVDAGVRRLIAFRDAACPESFDGPEHDEREHEVYRWCRLLESTGITADPKDLDLSPSSLTIPAETSGATLIHPGAASRSRRWPQDRWVEIAKAERHAGRTVIITGTQSERDLAFSIAYDANISASDVYAGRTSLREMAGLVAGAGRVVCGDTGVAHLASAFRRPSVILFGPTSPATWGPPPRAIHRILWRGITGDPHADTLDPGLAAITVSEVIEALRGLPSA